MQFFAAALTVAVALVGSATALPSISSSNSECNTGPVQCCNSMQSAKSEHMKSVLGALGILDQIAEGDNIGLTCSPIPITAIGGSQSCDTQPVCCSGKSYGLMSVSCMPINVNGL